MRPPRGSSEPDRLSGALMRNAVGLPPDRRPAAGFAALAGAPAGFAPLVGARPAAGFVPVAGARPAADLAPLAGARPAAGFVPVAGARPAAGFVPVAGARPAAGFAPLAGARPAAGFVPVAGARPAAGFVSLAGARPAAGFAPLAGARLVAGVGVVRVDLPPERVGVALVLALPFAVEPVRGPPFPVARAWPREPASFTERAAGLGFLTAACCLVGLLRSAPFFFVVLFAAPPAGRLVARDEIALSFCPRAGLLERRVLLVLFFAPRFDVPTMCSLSLFCKKDARVKTNRPFCPGPTSVLRLFPPTASSTAKSRSASPVPNAAS